MVIYQIFSLEGEKSYFHKWENAEKFFHQMLENMEDQGWTFHQDLSCVRDNPRASNFENLFVSLRFFGKTSTSSVMTPVCIYQFETKD